MKVTTFKDAAEAYIVFRSADWGQRQKRHVLVRLPRPICLPTHRLNACGQCGQG